MAHRKIVVIVSIVFSLVTMSPLMNSCVHQPFALPDSVLTGDPSICFQRDILPIFQSDCAKSNCHDEAGREGGYVLNNYTNIIKKGIVRGNPAASIIYKSIINASGVEFMPKAAPALSNASIYLIKQWIAGGAADSTAACGETCDTNNFAYSSSIKPLMLSYCAGCHYTSPLNFSNYTDVKNAALTGNLIPSISHTAGYQAMPQNAAKLPDCQITKVKKWVAAGALNN